MAKDMECYRAEYVNCKGTKFGTAHDGLEDTIYFPFHFLFFPFSFSFFTCPSATSTTATKYHLLYG